MNWTDYRELGVKAAREAFGVKPPGGDISSIQGKNNWQQKWLENKPNRSLTVSSSSERPA